MTSFLAATQTIFAGTEKDFFQNSDLTDGNNYNPAGLPSSSNDVLLTTSTTGLTLNGDYDALGVKPVDDSKASSYKNSDHAGTPENFKKFVIGGGTGGGGANYTGNYSVTASVGPCL